MNHGRAIQTDAHTAAVLDIPPSGELIVLRQPDETITELDRYNHGELCVATEGMAGTDKIGDLIVSYVIDCWEPRHDGQYGLWGYVATTGLSIDHLVGTDATLYTDSSAYIEDAGDAVRIVFNQPGTWELVLAVSGTGLGGTLTNTGGSGVTYATTQTCVNGASTFTLIQGTITVDAPGSYSSFELSAATTVTALRFTLHPTTSSFHM
jgi:hypothetical protein